jgi:hypothetical protein
MPKNAKKEQRKAKDQLRFGIGEWYGRPFGKLTPEERKAYADMQKLKKRDQPPQPCPFRTSPSKNCSKTGGVCSIRLYRKSGEEGTVTIDGNEGSLRALCPQRFKQDNTIYNLISQKLLRSHAPVILGEVPFLQASTKQAGNDIKKEFKDVGSIDNVLVHPDDPTKWCAVELQAVYFSGDSMNHEFALLRDYDLQVLPFPAAKRRPDYRSSGPKRLMPQLQTKVPTISRWGKKMAVVVDKDFYEALGEMNEVQNEDVSGSEIIWFVVKYVDSGELYRVELESVHLTTLDEAVKGLTGGHPVSMETFEIRIKERVAAQLRKSLSD